MPDRVTSENVVWYVGELVRRVDRIEQHTEDLNVIRRDITQCRSSVDTARGDMEKWRKEIDDRLKEYLDEVRDLRSSIVRSAIGASVSFLVFSLTIFSIFK